MFGGVGVQEKERDVLERDSIRHSPEMNRGRIVWTEMEQERGNGGEDG